MRREEDYILDYGNYERLTRHPRFDEVVTLLNKASKKSGVDYVVVGGLANYLYTHNPPLDFPDIDVLLDADYDGGRDFIDAIDRRKISQLDIKMTNKRESGVLRDMFSSFLYYDLQIDVFTSQEARPGFRMPIKSSRGLRLESVEYLIVEKLIRATWSDVRSAFDLILAGGYDSELVMRLASEYRLTGRVAKIERLISRYVKGEITKPVYTRLAKEFVRVQEKE